MIKQFLIDHPLSTALFSLILLSPVLLLFKSYEKLEAPPTSGFSAKQLELNSQHQGEHKVGNKEYSPSETSAHKKNIDYQTASSHIKEAPDQNRSAQPIDIPVETIEPVESHDFSTKQIDIFLMDDNTEPNLVDVEYSHIEMFSDSPSLESYILKRTECKNSYCRLEVQVAEDSSARSLLNDISLALLNKGKQLNIQIGDVDATNTVELFIKNAH